MIFDRFFASPTESFLIISSLKLTKLYQFSGSSSSRGLMYEYEF